MYAPDFDPNPTILYLSQKTKTGLFGFEHLEDKLKDMKEC
jgi:hypothetical protein